MRTSKSPTGLLLQHVKMGVEPIVILSSYSVLFPHPEKNPIALMHLKVEQALETSGLDWTFVRPGYLATNTLHWQSIRTQRLLRTAFPDDRACLVHERDVAEVAVRALTDESLRNHSFVIPGAGPMTVREQVATIAQAVGESIRLEEVDVATYRAELVTQVPESLADRLIQLKGQVPQLPDELRIDAVPQLLNRSPLSFAVWASDHAADFR